MTRSLIGRVFVPVAALALGAGCAGNATSPTAVSSGGAASLGSASSAGAHGQAPPAQDGVPTGERAFGKESVEPAYNADTGELLYLLTPDKAPLPAKANAHATSPLYLVEYPLGSTAAGDGHFNCEGVPGNCPDHDAAVAGAAAGAEPSVYGAGVLGHDHVVDPPGKPDFNIAWEVVEVVFTPQGVLDGAVNTRLTTDTAIEAAIANGDAIKFDLGFAFNCSVVPASVYWKGTPIQ